MGHRLAYKRATTVDGTNGTNGQVGPALTISTTNGPTLTTKPQRNCADHT
jgi:hypothetical protein